MILDEMWRNFKSSSDKSKKDLFIKYCIENIKENDLKNITIQTASRNICAACISMTENDAKKIPNFTEIENIACDLEVPDEYRDRSLDDWEKLKLIFEKIEKN